MNNFIKTIITENPSLRLAIEYNEEGVVHHQILNIGEVTKLPTGEHVILLSYAPEESNAKEVKQELIQREMERIRKLKKGIK